LLYRIRCNDDQQLARGIGFDNDFPPPPSVPSVYNEAILDDVCTMTTRMLEHAAEINLIEVAIFHAFEQMRTQLKLPQPPVWPLMLPDDSSGNTMRWLHSA